MRAAAVLTRYSNLLLFVALEGLYIPGPIITWISLYLYTIICPFSWLRESRHFQAFEVSCVLLNKFAAAVSELEI